ncbi:Alpha/beta hydrolase domain-containing protein 4 [Phytophthora pseudosyringae]|uniref:Alpha/beta hydrolase domain-containing protein 4 n=1 Tax=Phytophthora pseudosyringae TaxID=221518 RepID=A0A8T1VH40_9STRA|nr:Alpha/beta hydrolase domain-containing protein 4 [Phytophthora pseudosyringae]
MKRPRVAARKVVAVLSVLVLLTPVWIAYGCLGGLLTRPSCTVTRTGLLLLAALSAWFGLHVVFATTGGDVGNLWGKLEVGGRIVALLLAQWQLDHLLVFHIRQKPEERRIDVARLAALVIFAITAVSLRSPNFEGLSQWQTLSSYPMQLLYMYVSRATDMFWAVYILLPVAVVVSEARLWVPARYSELARLEYEIIGCNVKVPFEMLKVAGLGTVHVPCTAPVSEETQLPLVLLHGYAAGNALWACNFEELATHYDVYAIEWLGTGRSNRPKFISYEWDYVNGVMVEALEKWRKELKIDKFYLGGHSMGAMFATSYTVKYPGHVQHLALISPAGVGHPPAPNGLPLGLRIFRSIWNLRLTPMSVARYAGPLGPRFLRFVSSVRVSVMPETSCIRRGLIPLDVLAAYWYNNWALEKSGEVAMHSHLLPGAYAKRPLCEMLTPENIQIPITFLYGGGPDWMSSSNGEKVAKVFDGKQSVKVVLVPGAGHQLFMDNAPAFNEMLLEALARD